jgi:hypothetical protein
MLFNVNEDVPLPGVKPTGPYSKVHSVSDRPAVQENIADVKSEPVTAKLEGLGQVGASVIEKSYNEMSPSNEPLLTALNRM